MNEIMNESLWNYVWIPMKLIFSNLIFNFLPNSILACQIIWKHKFHLFLP